MKKIKNKIRVGCECGESKTIKFFIEKDKTFKPNIDGEKFFTGEYEFECSCKNKCKISVDTWLNEKLNHFYTINGEEKCIIVDHKQKLYISIDKFKKI